jgi:hypothetical protein
MRPTIALHCGGDIALILTQVPANVRLGCFQVPALGRQEIGKRNGSAPAHPACEQWWNR